LSGEVPFFLLFSSFFSAILFRGSASLLREGYRGLRIFGGTLLVSSSTSSLLFPFLNPCRGAVRASFHLFALGPPLFSVRPRSHFRTFIFSPRSTRSGIRAGNKLLLLFGLFVRPFFCFRRRISSSALPRCPAAQCDVLTKDALAYDQYGVSPIILC